MRLGNRENNRRRRDTGPVWQGSSENEQWALEEGAFHDESTCSDRFYRDEGNH
jgi:hypothetical protein